MNPVELLMRRRNVRAFIKADPVNIVVLRQGPSVKTPAGGYIKGTIQTLDSQEGRIVLNKRRFNPGVINSEAGDITETDYLLIGQHTFDLEVGDVFHWLGQQYKVIGIHLNRQESLLASIDLLGKPNRE